MAKAQERWTVLHAPSRSTLGAVSESHLCVDCGFNTAPGLPTRKQLDAWWAVSSGPIPMHLTWEQEVYLVNDKVWEKTGLDGYGGCLCVGCLEKRIGRRLKPKDFVPDHPFNQSTYPASKRLRDRRGK
jgi:hypothetical protein